MKFCPQCNRLAEFDSYLGRDYCTSASCNWRSEKIKERKDERRELVTDKGVLRTKIDNGDYPGVYVLLGEEVVAKIEYEPDLKKIRTISYKDDQDEPETIVDY